MNSTCPYALFGNYCSDMDELHSEGEVSERYSFLMDKFHDLCRNLEHVNCPTCKDLNKKFEEVEIK